jgi:hypothetical protein
LKFVERNSIALLRQGYEEARTVVSKKKSQP